VKEMDTSKLSIKLKLDKPRFIDENTIEIGWYINGIKQSRNLKACNDGKGWHLVK
jgi:hypothetical protein